MVRASIHPKREEFTSKNPGKFAEIESKVMSRADEPMSQLAYYMFLNNGNKNKIPTILKKSKLCSLFIIIQYCLFSFTDISLSYFKGLCQCLNDDIRKIFFFLSRLQQLNNNKRTS